MIFPLVNCTSWPYTMQRGTNLAAAIPLGTPDCLKTFEALNRYLGCRDVTLVWQSSVNSICNVYVCVCVDVSLYLNYTSSTAQGGDGSFKDRNTMGKVELLAGVSMTEWHWLQHRCLTATFWWLHILIHLSFCLSIRLSDCLSACPSHVTLLSFYLSFCLSVCLTIKLSIHLSTFSFFLSIYLSVHLIIYLSIYLSNRIESNPIWSNLI